MTEPRTVPVDSQTGRETMMGDTGGKWLGLEEVADLLRVGRMTPNRWRYRKVMPEPDEVISGTPIWKRSTIVAWAKRTNRLPEGVE